VLNRMQRLGVPQPLGGDHLLAVERGDRHQAGVDCHPFGRRGDARPRDQNRAGAALTLGAALLAAGETLLAQEVQRRGPDRDIVQGRIAPVDYDLGSDHHTVLSTHSEGLGRHRRGAS
jgi:hypothetical protein